ncbi:MAG: SOS response-associated peptidase [Jatrophihabitans sp.]
MCGRYVSVQADSDLLAEFEAEDATDGGFEPAENNGYNVAPTVSVRAVVSRRRRGEDGKPHGDPVRQLRVMTWGLVPSWAKDRSIGNKLFNARAESVPSKPAFRRAFAARRCLVPADGWYEWQRAEDSAGKPVKQPYFMTPSAGAPLAFAGLYEFWGEPGALLTSCTIITTESMGVLADIHDRMPLALPKSSWARWLDPAVADASNLLSAWDEASGEHLELRPVSTEVNNARHEGAALIDPVQPAPSSATLF